MIWRQCFLWIDKLIFCAGALLGVQLPSFVVQYLQRINGHLSEAKQHLSQYQAIADRWTEGDLNKLLENYHQNTNPIVQETGTVLESLMNRVELLTTHITEMEQSNIFQQLYLIATQAESNIVEAAWQAYSFTVPLTQDSLVIGLGCAIAMSMSWNALRLIALKTLSWIYKRGQATKTA